MKEKNLFDTIFKLIEVNLELFRIEIKEEVSNWVIRLGIFLVVLLVANLFIVLGSFTLAFLLADLFGNNIYGFGLVALFYLILTFILWVSRKNLYHQIRQSLQQNLLDSPEKKEEAITTNIVDTSID